MTNSRQTPEKIQEEEAEEKECITGHRMPLSFNDCYLFDPLLDIESNMATRLSTLWWLASGCAPLCVD